MVTKQSLSLIVFLFFTTLCKAGDAITAEVLAGTWKITDVKISTSGNSVKSDSPDKCYLCDLYRAGMGLVFTTDGKVSYSNYGNPNPVLFAVFGNTLTLYAEPSGQAEKKETSVQFGVSLNSGILTLVYASETTTETYTLTK